MRAFNLFLNLYFNYRDFALSFLHSHKTMGLDDEDLERAGTRSRRQLTNSKKYSVYPPPLEQDVDQQDITTIDGQNHPLRKPNTYLSNLVKSRSRAFTLICCILIILFVCFYRYPSIHLPSRKDTNTLFEEKVEFNDSSQYTDYALLDRLLIDKKGLFSAVVK